MLNINRAFLRQGTCLRTRKANVIEDYRKSKRYKMNLKYLRFADLVSQVRFRHLFSLLIVFLFRQWTNHKISEHFCGCFTSSAPFTQNSSHFCFNNSVISSEFVLHFPPSIRSRFSGNEKVSIMQCPSFSSMTDFTQRFPSLWDLKADIEHREAVLIDQRLDVPDLLIHTPGFKDLATPLTPVSLPHTY